MKYLSMKTGSVLTLSVLMSLGFAALAQEATDEKILKIVLKRDGQCISEKSYIRGDDEQWAIRLLERKGSDGPFVRGVARLESCHPRRVNVTKIRKSVDEFEAAWVALSFETKELREKETVLEFDFIGNPVNGKVVDDTGRPVEGVQVAARLKPESIRRDDITSVSFCSLAITGQDGCYTLKDLLPGAYILELAEMGIQQDGSYKLGGQYFWPGSPVEFEVSSEKQPQIAAYRIWGPSHIRIKLTLEDHPLGATTFSFKPAYPDEGAALVPAHAIPGMDYQYEKDGERVTVVRQPLAFQTNERGEISFFMPRVPLRLSKIIIRNTLLGEIRKTSDILLGGKEQETVQCSLPGRLSSINLRLPGLSELPRSYGDYRVQWGIFLFPRPDNPEEFASYREIDAMEETTLRNLVPGKYHLWLRAELLPGDVTATSVDPETHSEAFCAVNSRYGRSLDIDIGPGTSMDVVLEESTK